MKCYSDQEIASIHSTLSSERFNALRMKVTTKDADSEVSPWWYTNAEEKQGAELERNTKRDKGSR
jgi:hypothetical protein